MIEECPFCGSIRIVETLKGGTRICLACESRFDTVNGKSKQTLFDRITSSPEVLAESLVFWEGGWTSRFIKFTTTNRDEAIAATVAKLNEVENG